MMWSLDTFPGGAKATCDVSISTEGFYSSGYKSSRLYTGPLPPYPKCRTFLQNGNKPAWLPIAGTFVRPC